MERRGKSALFSNFLSDVINTLSIGQRVDKKRKKEKIRTVISLTENPMHSRLRQSARCTSYPNKLRALTFQGIKETAVR